MGTQRSTEPLENRTLRIHGTVLCVGSSAFVAAVLAGRFAAVGPLRFLHEVPIASIGFLEAFLLATIVGLFLRQASTLVITWPWSVLAAVTHIVLATVNVTHWGFYRGIDAELPGAIATAVHVALAGLELAMARRNRLAVDAPPARSSSPPR